MKKKILMLLCAVCLIVPAIIFVGCGKQSDPELPTSTYRIEHTNVLFDDYWITVNAGETIKDKLKTYDGYTLDESSISPKFGSNLIIPKYTPNDCSAVLAINGIVEYYNLPRGIEIDVALASQGFIVTDYNSCGWFDLSDREFVEANYKGWNFVKPATNTLIPSSGYLELETYIMEDEKNIEAIQFQKNEDGVSCKAILNGTSFTNNFIVPQMYGFEDEQIFREVKNVEIKYLEMDGALILPTTVKSISSQGAYGVYMHGCDSINLPEGLENFSANIENCDITNIRIPSTLTSFTGSINSRCYDTYMGTYVAKPSLSVIVVDKDNEIYTDGNMSNVNVSVNNTYFDDIRYSKNVIIEKDTNKLIYGCNNSIIPEGVVEIGESAFQFCSFTNTIELPSSLTKIGDSAFYGCRGIKRVALKENVECIKSLAFARSDLKYIYITKSVTTIEADVFFGLDHSSAIIFLEHALAPDGFETYWNTADYTHDLVVKYNVDYPDFILETNN